MKQGGGQNDSCLVAARAPFFLHQLPVFDLLNFFTAGQKKIHGKLAPKNVKEGEGLVGQLCEAVAKEIQLTQRRLSMSLSRIGEIVDVFEKRPKRELIHTGLEFDRTPFSLFGRGDLILLAGAPSTGKSALCTRIGVNAALSQQLRGRC